MHLRTAVPKYVWRNMIRINRENPSLEVTLLSDQEENLKKARKIGLLAEKYAPSDSVLDTLESHSLSSAFRNGFWQTSILRLFAFLEYVEDADYPMVHIESDVLTANDFPWSAFTTLQNCAWLQFNQERDVAAIVYCPNSSEAEWLKNTLIEFMSSEVEATDMTLLSAISEKYQSRVTLLPIAQKSDSILYSRHVAEEARVRNSSSFNLFGGIFDSAPLGMWLMGQDARNHYGVLQRHIHLPDSYIDARQLRIYSRKSKMFVADGEEIFRLYNLHLHSKITTDFGPLSDMRIHLGVFLNKFSFPLYTFAPVKLIAVFGEVYKRLGNNPVRFMNLMLSKLAKRR